MPATPFRVVGLAGSLRRGSFNRSLLRALQELAPETLTIEIHDVADLPLYNADIEAEGLPTAVERLQAAVRAADGLLIVTPEYNSGMPAVTKNTVDWLSRAGNVLDNKPTAVCGASPGATGTALSQAQLRQVLVNTNTPTLAQPRVLVGLAHEKFDAEGKLVHESTRQFLTKFLFEFGRWIGHFQPLPD
jgi:chromate reductase